MKAIACIVWYGWPAKCCLLRPGCNLQSKPLTNFTHIHYLRNGSEVQRRAFEVLTSHRIMELLAAYNPLLAGTIPIDIAIDGSDLDIICCYNSQQAFTETLRSSFSAMKHFRLSSRIAGPVIASFLAGEFPVEVYGATQPSHQQPAYRHMLVEYRLLRQYGEPFRRQVIDLKKQGIKTEPAFARLLGLEGDPYEQLLLLSQ